MCRIGSRINGRREKKVNSFRMINFGFIRIRSARRLQPVSIKLYIIDPSNPQYLSEIAIYDV